MNYAPIKKQRVSDIIIQRIKSSIESGNLKPGDKLPSERELASALSVSRGALREAISVLEAKGILEVQSGKGIFLVENTQNELFRMLNSIFQEDRTYLIELLELRQSIESQAAYYAAERRTEQDLQKIENTLIRLEKSIREQQLAVQEDYDFHSAVVEASHNSMMVHTLRLLSDAMMQGLHEARSEAKLIPGKTEVVLEEHKNIYHSIKESNPENARAALVLHLENVKRQVTKFV